MEKKVLFISKKMILFMLIVVITVCASFFTTKTVNAATWKTGRFNGYNYTGKTRVKLKKQKKNASVTLYVYKKNKKGVGKNCQSMIDIRMTDSRGRCIWSGTKKVKKDGVKLKLGNDHSVYYIAFKYHKPSVDVVSHLDDWNPKDVAEPDYWGLKYTSNCQP